MSEKLKTKEFFTPDRIREIKQEISEFECQLKGGDDNSPDGVGFMRHTVDQIQDPTDIKREINRRHKLLKDGMPQPFKNTATANKAYDWCRKAERWINEHHPKNVSVKYPNKGREEHDFDRGVNEMVDWLKKGDKVYSQYRYLMRRLDPSNPYAGRIEGI